MTFPALSVIVIGTPDRPEAAITHWKAALDRAAIAAEVVTGPGRMGPGLNAPLSGARGEFVLIVPADVQPGAWFDALWADRRASGFTIIGGESQARDAGSRGGLQRALSLPVTPEGDGVFARRAALAHPPLGTSDIEWLVEALVLANSDGWPIRRTTAPGGRTFPTRLPLGSLWRLWVLRNSAFSADYDERAYNSVIPLQRYWQRARHRIIHSLVDPTTRILDIGCGSSRIVQDLPHSVGLDIQIKKLRRIAARTRKVVQATLTQLPFPTHAFETLICSQVIEHVPEPLVDWHEMNRVLEVGGILVVGTPDYATIAWPVLECLYGIVHPKGYVHEHINQYTARSLVLALETHGFEVLERAYVGGGELIIKARKVADTA
ncbi:MAG TPA: class I SAM-dependent methyltransferase [Luteitalea sp.]|nr:class I SAM-dependent methyltransferase [Luteitalea sp.]